MKYFSTLLIVLLLSSFSYSQVRSNKALRPTWVFEMGPAIGIMEATGFSPTGYGAILEPRLIFGKMGRRSTVSLGIPLKAFYFSRTVKDSTVYDGFSANVPIVLDFNFYHGAFKGPDHKLGAYFGAGWNFNYVTFSTVPPPSTSTGGVIPGETTTRDLKEDYGGLNHGPYFNGGIRFNFGNGASFDLRGFVNMGLGDKPLSLYGVAILYNFGMKRQSYSKGGWF